MEETPEATPSLQQPASEGKGIASPQLKDGYTPIANELMEAFATLHLGTGQTQILFVVLRKTFGWQKPDDRISYGQLAKATGLPRRSVIRALQELAAREIVNVTPNGYINTIALQKNHLLWHKTGDARDTTPQTGDAGDTRVVTPGTLGGDARDTKTGDARDTHKRNKSSYTKEIPKKGTRTARPAGDSRVGAVMRYLEELRGYPSPAYGREGKAVKGMLVNHSPEDILACWQALKLDGFWANKELFMDKVADQLPGWVKGGRDPRHFTKRGGSGNGHKPGAARSSAPARGPGSTAPGSMGNAATLYPWTATWGRRPSRSPSASAGRPTPRTGTTWCRTSS